MNRPDLPTRRVVALATVLISSAATGCVTKQTAGTRASGQSRLMDDTFAGQNACNPDDHKRPFIIEWDATDASSFESQTASDVVFVKYEGCSLVVLDECKNDSLAGDMGAYKPVEWTTGALETIDIQNTGELYAKLPLGEATLGARVSGGETFHMEYYVAGTRYATRDAVYEADIEGRYGCEDATHFVYAYNLGAFALGSTNEFVTEAGASAFGFGGGAGTNNSSSADKRGGDLGLCRSDSATEIAGCKAPIRLSLRKIRPGKSPEAQAMAAPDTGGSMTAAAVVDAKVEMSADAKKYLQAAIAKQKARDGKGCLAEFDNHDKVNPNEKSTEPSSRVAVERSVCLMLAGKCEAGRELHIKWNQKWNPDQGDAWFDSSADAIVGKFCQGGKDPRDQLLAATDQLMTGAYVTKKSVKYCGDAYAQAKSAIGKAKPKSDSDDAVNKAKDKVHGNAAACFVNAGDCDKGWKTFQETSEWVGKPAKRETFEAIHSACKK